MARARELGVAALVAVAGWTICAAVLSTTAYAASLATALAVNSVVAPVLFALVSIAFFRRPTALHPAVAGAVFVGVGIAFAVVTAVTVPARGVASLGSVTGTWLPLALVFVATWGIGLAARDPSERTRARSERDNVEE
jgi:hypothetical protein